MSSGLLEAARRRLRLSRPAFARLWIAGTALGAAFLAGQVEVWRELAAAGIYVATNPGSGFFYVLTAMHGAHLLGGLVALAYIGFHALRWQLGPAKRTATDAAAWFWHYLGALWLVLLALFLVW
jgi:cytochrome c oxidase subunit 3